MIRKNASPAEAIEPFTRLEVPNKMFLRLNLVVLTLLTLYAPAQDASTDEDFRQALVALKESHFDTALEKLAAASHRYPNDARIHNFLGITLTSMGRNDDAIAEYKNAIRLDGFLGDAYRNLGFLEWTGHQLTAATADLKRAAELLPEDAFAHQYLCRVYLDTGHYTQALEELNRSRAPVPSEPAFLLQLSAAYIATKRPADARNILKQLAVLSLTDLQYAQTASFFWKFMRPPPPSQF